MTQKGFFKPTSNHANDCYFLGIVPHLFFMVRETSRYLTNRIGIVRTRIRVDLTTCRYVRMPGDRPSYVERANLEAEFSSSTDC